MNQRTEASLGYSERETSFNHGGGEELGLASDGAVENLISVSGGGNGATKRKVEHMNTALLNAKGAFFQKTAEIPLLSAEEEADLSKRIVAGNQAHSLIQEAALAETCGDPARLERLGRIACIGDVAREKMIESNFRLVCSIAKGFTRRIGFMDAVQEGVDGLMVAVERFDPSRGYKFSTYASPWIKQRIQRSVRTYDSIGLPHHVNIALRKAERFKQDFMHHCDVEPSEQQIADHIGLPVDQFRVVQNATRVESLDNSYNGQEGETLGNRLPDESILPVEQSIISSDIAERVKQVVNSLTDENERYVLWHRFGLGEGDPAPRSLTDIGHDLGLKYGQVYRIMKCAIGRLAEVPDLQEVYYDLTGS